MASKLLCHTNILLFILCLFSLSLNIYSDSLYTYSSDHLSNIKTKDILVKKLVYVHKRSLLEDDEAIKRDFSLNGTNATILYDPFKYYTSRTAVGDSGIWEDILSYKETKIETTLSNAYLRAVPVTLSFEFPFYGHLIKNITITTGGFLYTGSQHHQWLPATQYIAPLMSNFDTSLHANSSVYYFDNGTCFIALWKEVILKDRQSDGNFTFQVILNKNGDITFAYKQVSIPISLHSSSIHPVKIGLSDAYYIDQTMFSSKRRTIYEYDRIELNVTFVSNLSTFHLNPLPNCITITNCQECISANISLQCGWCPVLQRCSDGFDRHRQDWIDKNCMETGITTCDSEVSSVIFKHDSANPTHPYSDTGNNSSPFSSQFMTTTTSVSSLQFQNTSSSPIHIQPVSIPTLKYEVVDACNTTTCNSSTKQPNQKVMVSSGLTSDGYLSFGAGGIIGILLVLVCIIGLIVGIIYAYKHPQTSSGQFLIRYRPSQWRWKWNDSETKYTAASSVHI